MKRLKKKRRYRHQVTRKARALAAWLKQVRERRPTPVSARQIRKIRHTFRKNQPDVHKELKVASRAKRILDHKLNGTRVSWARKIWMGRRVAEGKNTNDRHFQGALRTSTGPVAGSPGRDMGIPSRKLKGNTHTISPKLGLSKYRYDYHPLHQRRRVDTSPRTGCYAQVREKKKRNV